MPHFHLSIYPSTLRYWNSFPFIASSAIFTFWFSAVWMMSGHGFLWIYPVLHSPSFLKSVNLYPSPNLGTLQPLCFQIFFLHQSLSPFLQRLQYHECYTSHIVPQVPEALVLFCFVLSSKWIIYIDLSSGILIPCSAISILLQNLSSEVFFFLISDIFFSSKIPTWFFFILSISLLK